MKTFLCLSLLVVLLAFPAAVACGQDVELVGQIKGEYTAVTVKGKYLYAGEITSDKARLRKLTKGLVPQKYYIGPEDEWSVFTVWNIADLKKPVRLGTALLPTFVKEIAISNDLAYLACGADGGGSLEIVDVRNPAKPVWKGCLRGNHVEDGEGVVVSGSVAYVAMEFALYIIDVSDPDRPVLMGTFDVKHAVGIALSRNLVYVATREDGLQIIDVADPRKPVLQGQLKSVGYNRNPAVSGSLAYVTTWDGVQVIDISNPTKPTLRGIPMRIKDAFDIAVSDGLAYVIAPEKGLQAFELGSATAPSLRGSCDNPEIRHILGVSDRLIFTTTSHRDSLCIFRDSGGNSGVR